jgi:hypothetical protein
MYLEVFNEAKHIATPPCDVGIAPLSLLEEKRVFDTRLITGCSLVTDEQFLTTRKLSKSQLSCTFAMAVLRQGLEYESGCPIIQHAMVAPLIWYYLLSLSNLTTLSVPALFSVQRWDG